MAVLRVVSSMLRLRLMDWVADQTETENGTRWTDHMTGCTLRLRQERLLASWTATTKEINERVDVSAETSVAYVMRGM